MSYKGKMSSKRGGKSANPFERMMQEQCNKPVAAKSAGIVGKWGATSFTSLRTSGEKASSVPKPKKFFKSRGENSENKESIATNDKLISDNSSRTSENDIKIKEKRREKVGSSSRERKLGGRAGWSPPPSRPPLERSPLHPSPPTSNPSTTPPRSRAPIRKTRSKEGSPPPPPPKELPPVKSEKISSFDSLFTSALPERKSRLKQKEVEVKREGRKRKQADEDDEEEMPRIKLKISFNKSPDKTEVYKVVKSKEEDLLSTCSQSSTGSVPTSESGSDRTDLSNGHHKHANSRAAPWSSPPPAAASSPLPPPRWSPEPPPPSPPQQPVARKYSRRNRGAAAAVNNVPEPSTVAKTKSPSPDPEIDFPKQRKPPKKVSPPVKEPSPPVEPEAMEQEQEEPEEFLPTRKPAAVKAALSESKQPSTYKRTIFKSRAKPADVVPATPAAIPDSPEFDDLDFPNRKPAAVKAATAVKQPATYKRTTPADVDSVTPTAIPGSPEFDDLDFPPSRKPAAVKAAKQPAAYKRTKAADVDSAAPVAMPGSPELDDLDFPPSRKPAAKQLATYKRAKAADLESATTPTAPLEFDDLDFPSRKPAAVKAATAVKQPATYKRTIFKSRAKPPPPPVVEETPDPVGATQLDPEPPRVPPVEDHFVNVSSARNPRDEVAKILKGGEKKEEKAEEEVVVGARRSRRTEASRSTNNKSSPTPSLQPVSDLKEEEEEQTEVLIRPSAKKKEPAAHIEKPKIESSSISEKINKKSAVIENKNDDEPISDKISDNQDEISELKVNELASIDTVTNSSQETLNPPSPQPFSLDFDDFPSRIRPEKKKTDFKPKIVPGKKTFFKSKSATTAAKGPGKALSLYKHNVGWSGDKHDQHTKGVQERRPVDSMDFEEDEEDEFGRVSESEPMTAAGDISFAPTKLTRVATYPTQETNMDDNGELVTQVKCPKSYKSYFTVIKNVKRGHEINDLGENQEFQDDVEYIIDGLNVRHAISLRCLTAISLASKCLKPNFRMHLRAHSVVTKFFAELQDAPENSSLALCTSTVLFVLSQDRLNMDMDRDSLKLMLNLLDTDSKIGSALEGTGMDKKELQKNKQKVIDICAEMQKKGHAGSLNLDLISADHLSMETLLSMTSKRAGEWFKEELRELGGLGHLSKTFSDCVNYLTIKPITSWSETLKDKLKKANRILRVLENVTNENEENCNFIIDYKIDTEEFLGILQKLFELLDTEVQLNPTTENSDKESVGVVIREALFSLMRVHVNLVHDYTRTPRGSLIIGQYSGMMQRALRCLFIIPFWFVPLSKRFECLVLSLALLINLVENCFENRQSIMDSMAAQKELGFCVKEEPRLAIEDLVQMYLDREELARLSEAKTDNILDNVEEEVQEIDPKEEERTDRGKDNLEETVAKLINKAGSHMESSIIAAYIGLVLGYLTVESEDFECRIREYLPTRDFVSMVAILERLNKFMEMTSNGSAICNKSIKGTKKIIKHLEKLDAPPEPEPEEESALDFTFETSRDDITLPDGPDFTQFGAGFDDFGKF